MAADRGLLGTLMGAASSSAAADCGLLLACLTGGSASEADCGLLGDLTGDAGAAADCGLLPASAALGALTGGRPAADCSLLRLPATIAEGSLTGAASSSGTSKALASSACKPKHKTIIILIRYVYPPYTIGFSLDSVQGLFVRTSSLARVALYLCVREYAAGTANKFACMLIWRFIVTTCKRAKQSIQ